MGRTPYGQAHKLIDPSNKVFHALARQQVARQLQTWLGALRCGAIGFVKMQTLDISNCTAFPGSDAQESCKRSARRHTLALFTRAPSSLACFGRSI
jgi:hypothetical protein